MNKKQYLLEIFQTIIKNKKLAHLYLFEGGTLEEKKELMFELVYIFLKTDIVLDNLKNLINNNEYQNFII